MSKKEVSLKRTMETKQAISYLEDIVSSMKAGTVCVQRGDEFVTLKPSAPIDMDIEAEQKKDKESLVIELSWRTATTAPGEPEKIMISAKEPEKGEATSSEAGFGKPSAHKPARV